ncbi:MAG: XdhC /CoxI family-like protein [Rhodobacteraceae bacterium]|nr:XdhC /CoxI family-like protein [Paracoccaceae bacterium]
MTPAELTDRDIADLALDLRAKGAPFAIATVIRTAGATAAKPGAKALLLADGTIAQGWIGGGCVRGALAKAARQSFEDGEPRLISLHPQDILAEKGVEAGEITEGVQFARNGCPSKGSMDIFVEPVLPLPELVIYGTSPVAEALQDLTARFQWAVRQASPDVLLPQVSGGNRRMIVVATQGKGDLAALRAALEAQCEFVAFVGSRRKFASLATKLEDQGMDRGRLDRVHAPAGLHINAVTPEEIALSILAQLTQIRRHKQRDVEGEE